MAIIVRKAVNGGYKIGCGGGNGWCLGSREVHPFMGQTPPRVKLLIVLHRCFSFPNSAHVGKISRYFSGSHERVYPMYGLIFCF